MSNRGGSNRGQGRKKLNNFDPDDYDSNAFASMFRLDKNDDELMDSPSASIKY